MEDDALESSQDGETDGKLHIVGVGASAGGLEALESFFHAMPADSGMAFVVIQHLSPDFKSHMEELLSRQTSIPVHRAEDGASVQANTIYLIPPNKEMVISDSRLRLTERSSDRSQIHPIDQFLTSLAADQGDRGLAVILSGTGSDGSRGIADVSHAGGLVLAQDEHSAKFDGMPMSANATGKVDLVLPPAAIAESLVAYAQEGLTKEQLETHVLESSSVEGIERIAALLNQRYGLDFSQYKSGTVGRRVQRRATLTGCESIEDYISLLRTDDTELNNLYEDLLIGVTKFFRDPEAYAILKRQVIAKLLRDAVDEPVRIWVAACASGEEAYSIAIVVDEELRKLDHEVEVKIFATDAHQGSLQIAAKGVYSTEALSELSDERVSQYFTRASDGYHVNRSLRNYVVFAAHNIIDDAPFTQMDLVSCRNMLIYLQPAAQRQALGMFHFALKAKGTLFLGPSESPGELSGEFKTIDSKWRFYTKRRDVRLAMGVRSSRKRSSEKLPRVTLPTAAPRSNRVDPELIKTYDQVLARMMPCSILTSETGDVLHVFGGAERFMQNRGGRPSNHLLEVIDDSLRTSVSVAWHHAMKKESAVRDSSTTFESGNGNEDVRITVTPMSDGDTGPNNFLIAIEVTGKETTHPDPIDASHREMHRTRVESLESDLQVSQENLQSALEEMESSNEELQASNQELIASNEELQSTNEELHSVNEELYTVNAEHQRRVEELATANDDMENLLATTRVGVIFLDKDLYIRRFTPEISKVFQLSSEDTGRSMEHFAHALNHPDLVDELRKVLETQEEMEVKVTDRYGTYFLLRVLPYRSGDTTEGLVLTLIDINSLEAAAAEIHLQKLAIESAVNGIVITDPHQNDDPIVYANQGFLDLTGYERNEVLGRNCRFLQCEDTNRDAVSRIRSSMDEGVAARVAILNHRKDGSSFWNDLSITPVRNQAGEIVNFVGVQHDVTAQVEAQQRLEDANRAAEQASDAKSSFLATMSHELRTPLTAVLGFADILRNESDDPEYLEKIDTIRRNGAYLLALLNDILDLSKIEAGKLSFGRESIDVRAVLKEVEILLQVRAGEADVPLRFDLRQPLPVAVTADEVRVRQILVNLISNAIKFTEDGEVVIEAKMSKVPEGETASQLEISVVDTGIGISETQLTELFTPFNQAHVQTTRHAGGTGLGLSISKRLAEGMNGAIEVESELGKGSRFTLILPVTAEQSQKLIGEAELDAFEQSKRPSEFPQLRAKILLADDRRDVWLVGKHFLEKCGAQVKIAENGQQAVEMIESAAKEDAPFELILMDMQMPVLDGRQAVAKLRDLGHATPVIALTADAMDGEREACIEMGCDEYFPKPIDGLLLTNLIADMLQRAGAEASADDGRDPTS
ncbi:chemotaxis protein CheB [Allorhodopirellula solitaria]|uniref:Autoinducer 2 sensor kinase/phosphatase LuxQ n=1 Tax=Allorhodopirellula solitaria TaxID=2527987 RepID=A0A5C5YJC3_9BACT|nr:chemotaxis protein CheB [Allorhodopirellula solitaria]TWT74976.1 Autoinducer 2 sensor kinase/phosphatase LuxQ [Allorhodopirellula solitaria]